VRTVHEVGGRREDAPLVTEGEMRRRRRRSSVILHFICLILFLLSIIQGN
jgi:hypothetical protein